ncbi:MAG: glycoside hydrolase family 3 N-terminal domain-containing protein, partial [Eubacteriales bacterium]|nr:glycoside hydrolase family 3 N-terminal domain-containing protein [Eubacteriales bacterium]
MELNQISGILQRMTLEEKAELCSGADFWHTKEVERLGVPALTISDGPSGLRKQEGSGSMGLHESSQSISFPSGSLAASSFDRALLRKLGETLGEECQAEKVDILLGPSMNIKRSPLCGRNFEYYSEDPYVSGELAGAYVDGLQEKGVGACPKHFYGNNMEERRMSTSSEMEERTAREIYLPAFERMVTEHQPRTIMCSYNKINGVYAAENREALTDILREEWGFEGSVISDWGAVNDRAKDLDAGLDLEMPSSHGAGPKAILKAIEGGSLAEEELDLVCERLLRTIAKSSAANRTAADTKTAAEGGVYHWEKDHETAKQIAKESMVLLKNDSTLPLSEKQNIVFIGPYAKAPRYQGGGSAHVQPWRVEAAWDAVKDSETVTYIRGFRDALTGDEKEASLEELISEAAGAAAKADAAVLFVGIPEGGESEGFDRSDLKLPTEQTALIEAVAKVQSKTVVVLHNGAPVEMPWIDQVS